MDTVKLYSQGRLGLTENSQTKAVRFALLQKVNGTDTYKNVMPLVKCRDYFNDVVYHQNTNGAYPFEIYGFTWDYSQSMYNASEIKMLLTFDEELKDLHLLDLFCEETGSYFRIEETKVVFGDIGTSITGKYNYIVTFPRIFLNNAPVMSLFTLLLRCAFYGVEKYDYTDTLEGGINKFIAQHNSGTDYGILYTISKNYKQFSKFMENPFVEQFRSIGDCKKYVFTSKIHDDTGIQSFTNDLLCKSKDVSKEYYHEANLCLLDKVLNNV